MNKILVRDVAKILDVWTTWITEHSTGYLNLKTDNKWKLMITKIGRNSLWLFLEKKTKQMVKRLTFPVKQTYRTTGKRVGE